MAGLAWTVCRARTSLLRGAGLGAPPKNRESNPPPDEAVPPVNISQIFDILLDHLDTGIIVTGLTGRVLIINSEARRILFLNGPVIGARLSQLPVPYEILESVQSCIQSLTPQKKRFTIFYPTERTIKLTVLSFGRIYERANGLLLILEDVTELNQAEKMKKDMISSLSHELRTPVSAIQAICDALFIGADDDEHLRKEFLQMLRHQSERLGQLLNSLLELARLESTMSLVPKEEVWLKGLIDEVLSDFIYKAEEKGLQLIVTVPEDLMMHTHSTATRHILRNIVENALKFTSQGFVRIEAKEETAGGEKWIGISVEDSGPGIAPDDLDKIFLPFYQSGRLATDGKKGSGLGLSIAKGWAEKLGGRIEVVSQVGVGSRFNILLRASKRHGGV